MQQLHTAFIRLQQKANMPTLTAIIKNKETKVEYTDSDNVMIALYDHVDWGTCGGSAVCGSCVCNVLAGDEYFDDPDIMEQDMLEFTSMPHARLGCQLSLENVPDGKLVIRVP